MSSPHVIELEEYVPQRFPRDELPDAVGELLWPQYQHQVAVDFPSPKTGSQWQLTAQGWVGHLPLSDAWSIALRPKVPIENIFRMLGRVDSQETGCELCDLA